MTAHVVGGSPLPAPIAWGLAGALLAAVVVALRLHGVWRRLSAAVAVAAVVSDVVLLALLGGAPAAPFIGVDLRLSGDPLAQHSPLWVTGCARSASGVAVAVEGAGRISVVGVDGATLEEGSTASFLLRLAPGTHALTLDVVDGGHRAFSPAMHAAATVTVTGAGSPGAAPPCPGRLVSNGGGGAAPDVQR